MQGGFLIAWASLWRGDRLRTLAAVAGAGVAIFVALLHLAFLQSVRITSSQLYDLFDADLALISGKYQFLYNIPDFPLARLRQANTQDGVAAVAAVRIGSGYWVAPETQAASSMLLIGVEAAPAFVKDRDLRAALPELRRARHLLLDRHSDPDVGVLEIGLNGSLRGQSATVAGFYSLGLPMYAAATAVVSGADFRLYTGRDPQRIEIGLIRLQPGESPAAVAARLNALLPEDVRVLPMSELREQERNYFLEVKPLGVMVRFGLLLGLLVGATALYQALSSQMQMRLRDYAVLRAMGYSARFTYGVSALQLALLGGLAFLLAWLCALPTFALIARITHFPLGADGRMFAESLLLCLPMLAAAALPALRAGRAEPASLF
ncbi:MAG: hypothetical protein HZB71_13270 [Betaproteobacteria bacterium]|nr:hypothetical protein [Betaproteobacteria bacterium]